MISVRGLITRIKEHCIAIIFGITQTFYHYGKITKIEVKIDKRLIERLTESVLLNVSLNLCFSMIN